VPVCVHMGNFSHVFAQIVFNGMPCVWWSGEWGPLCGLFSAHLSKLMHTPRDPCNEHSEHAHGVRARHQRKPHDFILTRNSSACVSSTSFTVFGATLCDNIFSNEV
jgi:hypothetical protein